jgi:putative hydrolase of the HAD superfamily
LGAIDPTLIDGVDLLCLDAGNTIIFLDHARLAVVCADQGFATSAESLVIAEGHAKIAVECGETLDVGWLKHEVPGAQSWGITVGTMLHRAGLARERIAAVLDALWSAHRSRNLWSIVPDGLSDALGRLRASGGYVAVVSNSEGALERILEDQGILHAFDLVIDSGVVGIEKPHPIIFRMALERFGIPPARALHLGDTYGTDIVGACAAGLRVALVDPYDHLVGRHPNVPRVPGAADVANAIALARTARGRP